MKKQKKILIVVVILIRNHSVGMVSIKRAQDKMRKHKQSYRVIDLYRDSFSRTHEQI